MDNNNLPLVILIDSRKNIKGDIKDAKIIELKTDADINSIKNNAIILMVERGSTFYARSLPSIKAAFDTGAWLVFGGYEYPPKTTVLQRAYKPWALSKENASVHGAVAFKKSLYQDARAKMRTKLNPEPDLKTLAQYMEKRLRATRIQALSDALSRISYTPEKAIQTDTPKTHVRDFFEGEITLPPDFSAVKKSYTYLGEAGGAAVLRKRNQRTDAILHSVVIPVYKSVAVIENCLHSLLKTTSSDTEIIVVIDGAVDNAGQVAKDILQSTERAIILELSTNTGFANAMNEGAKLARGKYIIPLNADTILHSNNWLTPMQNILDEDLSVAIVGNKHIDASGEINSEGSEFDWQKYCYRHVGRDLPDPVLGNGIKERDMLTFACVMIRANVWRELGGLDTNYLRAYFEDSDFCMRARERGYKIIYTPESVITHIGRHSNAGGGFEYRLNAELFSKRWVKTGAVARFAIKRGVRISAGRVVVCMIACSEEEFIAASLKSVYELADKIIIVEGGTSAAYKSGLADSKGNSTDNTLKEIKNFPDKDNKIKLIRAPGRPWKNKNEMRNAYAKCLNDNDIMLLLDADEVFTETGLWRMAYLINKYDVVRPGFHLFWNNLDTLGTGRWDNYAQVKAVRWRKFYSYSQDHNMPTDPRGVPITDLAFVRTKHTREQLYCHYSWAGKSDEKLKAKCKFYVLQNGADVFPPDYFEKVILPWRNKMPISGTHPYGSGGAKPRDIPHPKAIQKMIDIGKQHDQ